MPQVGDKFQDVYGDQTIYKVISVRKNHYRLKIVNPDEWRDHSYTSKRKEDVHAGLKGGILKLLSDGLERAICRLEES